MNIRDVMKGIQDAINQNNEQQAFRLMVLLNDVKARLREVGLPEANEAIANIDEFFNSSNADIMPQKESFQIYTDEKHKVQLIHPNIWKAVTDGYQSPPKTMGELIFRVLRAEDKVARAG